MVVYSSQKISPEYCNRFMSLHAHHTTAKQPCKSCYIIVCHVFFFVYQESTEGLTPTIGFVNSNLEIGNYVVTLYDLGGGPRVRNIWKNYYPEVCQLTDV